MKKMKLLLSLALTALLAGCVTPYKPPQKGEPYALVKVKFSYAAVMRGTSVGARLSIRQNEGSPDKPKRGKYRKAHQKTYGGVRRNPRIPMEAIKIHPKRPTDVMMMVYFFWYTTEYRTTYVNGIPSTHAVQVYHERGCPATITFDPRAGKTYLLDYSSASVDKACTTRAYRQIRKGGGKFKLRNVGRRTPADKKKK